MSQAGALVRLRPAQSSGFWMKAAGWKAGGLAGALPGALGGGLGVLWGCREEKRAASPRLQSS